MAEERRGEADWRAACVDRLGVLVLSLVGSPGFDRVDGSEGKDTIYGGDGRDTLYGGDGKERERGWKRANAIVKTIIKLLPLSSSFSYLLLAVSRTRYRLRRGRKGRHRRWPWKGRKKGSRPCLLSPVTYAMVRWITPWLACLPTFAGSTLWRQGQGLDLRRQGQG